MAKVTSPCVGVRRRHPSLRVTLALSLVTETGGPADFEGGHVILGDVLKDDTASDPLRGMASAALADSARRGRGMDADLELAKGMYATALEHGHRSAAYNLGLYWEGHWDRSAPDDVVPDSTKAAQAYKRGWLARKMRRPSGRIAGPLEVTTPIAHADATKSELRGSSF